MNLRIELFSLNEDDPDLAAGPVHIITLERVVFTPREVQGYRDGQVVLTLPQPDDVWLHEGRAYSDLVVSQDEGDVKLLLRGADGRIVRRPRQYPFVQGTYDLLRIGPNGDFLGGRALDGGYVPQDDLTVPPFQRAEVSQS